MRYLQLWPSYIHVGLIDPPKADAMVVSLTVTHHHSFRFISQVQGSYDSELLQLQESFQSSIVHLLSDAVRQETTHACTLM